MLAPYGCALTISAVGRDPHVVVAEPAEEDRLRAARRRPADLAVLEAAETPTRHVHLVAHRIAQLRALEPHACPEIADRAVHLECAGLRREEDRAVLVVA